MTGWCRHMTRWLAPATPVLLVSRPQDAIEARLAGQVTPLVGQPWYDLTRRQRGELLAIADVQHGLPLLWTQGMGWREANHPPPIGTQLRLGQPALERADSAPNTSAAGMLAGASSAASRHHAGVLLPLWQRGQSASSALLQWASSFCNISGAAASARALSLRRNSCSSCRMRFLSALDCAFSACCRARADCWPRIQAAPLLDLLGVEPLAAAILTEFNLRKAQRFPARWRTWPRPAISSVSLLSRAQEPLRLWLVCANYTE